MKLLNLLKPLDSYKIYGSKNIDIRSIVDDSRKVKKGDLFVAVKGLNVNAHAFITGAVSSGAVAIIGEKTPNKSWLKESTYIKVPNSRRALSLLASAWYKYPSKKMKMIGVTGTDGKTTTANLIYWILNKAGKKVGLVTSISAKIGKKELDTGFHVTNPEPLRLQKFLGKMVERDCEYAVLEVTSHGLDQERVAGIDFDVGVLTNITHEHLDYHKNFTNYLWAKSKLFERVKKAAVLNEDDDWFLSINCVVPDEADVITYALKKQADITANSLKYVNKDMEFDVVCEDGTFRVKTKLLGDYNVLNILAAIGVAKVFGVKEEVVVKALDSFPQPKGRLDKVETDKGFEVYIDFAHTPNALDSVLNFLNVRKKGKLISVFGSAGERDVVKRAQMGGISARLADVSIFTAEDPRSEDVSKIIDEMVKAACKAGGVEFTVKEAGEMKAKDGNFFVRIPERGDAIAFAIQKLAKKGDTVVICGKGHEKSMAYDGVEYSWSDHQAVKIALKGGVKRILRK